MRDRLREFVSDRGSITPLVPVVVLALFMLGGLIVDGSRDLNARAEAQAYAEEAARAGATAADLTSSLLKLDDPTARQRVESYCAAVRASNDAVVTCEIDPNQPFSPDEVCGGQEEDIVVNTIVKVQIRTSLLGIVGISELTAGGAAKARPYEGLTAQDAC